MSPTRKHYKNPQKAKTTLELERNIARLMPWTKNRIAEYINAPFDKKSFERVMEFSEPIGNKLETMPNEQLAHVAVSECQQGPGGERYVVLNDEKKLSEELVGKSYKEVKEFLWKKIMTRHYHQTPFDDLQLNRFQRRGKVFKVGDCITIGAGSHEELVFITSIDYNKEIIGKTYDGYKLYNYFKDANYETHEDWRTDRLVKEKWNTFICEFATSLDMTGEYSYEYKGDTINSKDKQYNGPLPVWLFQAHYETSLFLR